jgi:hypothetical protein
MSFEIDFRTDLHIETGEATQILDDVEFTDQEVIDEMESLGFSMTGKDPEEVARAVWNWIRKKILGE